MHIAKEGTPLYLWCIRDYFCISYLWILTSLLVICNENPSSEFLMSIAIIVLEVLSDSFFQIPNI